MNSVLDTTGPVLASALFDAPIERVIAAAHEAIVMIDESQSIVALNVAAQRMFRCTTAQAVGSPLATLLPSALRAAHAGWVRQASNAERLPAALQQRRRVMALRCSGEEFPIELVISCIEGPDRPAPQRYYVAFIRDLSEEQALKGELEMVKQRLRAVVELAPIAIWIADRDCVLFANRAAARLFAAASGPALVGRSVYSLLHEESHAELRRQVASALAQAGEGSSLQGRVVCDNGETREVEVTIGALPDHGSTTVQMVVTDVTQRRREVREIESSRQALRRLSANVVEAREEERRRIARELHDELGQRLSALKMDLSDATAAGRAVDPARVGEMQGMLDEIVAAVRRIAADLRPMMLDDLGLAAAVEALARDASRRLGIPVHVDLDDVPPEADPAVPIALYRMVQEALTNVARHARCTEVQIELHLQDGDLVLSVSDDGVGLPEPALPREGQFGLLGMHERAAMLGGRFEAVNAPGAGACLRVRLPLRRRP